jgi:UDP-N-acetylglucosamine 2-epimerase (non-hydrolysing)
LKKLLFIFGTRPEAIKMAPLIKEFGRRPECMVLICVTAQHREMLDQVLDFFRITPDFDLNIMKPGQSLFQVTASVLKKLEPVLDETKPDIVFVQGDTTTVLAGALAGFYRKVKIAHIEAGLRSGDRYSPFPEEMNRILAGHLSDYHFAPTPRAAMNLKAEGIVDNVHVVGNTSIDALFQGLEIMKGRGEAAYASEFPFLKPGSRMLLVTGHRRESFGGPFENICRALRSIADGFQDVEIVYPVHLNPNVRAPVNSILKGHKRIHLTEPVSYPHLLWLMNRSYMVLTDSGGIQEEAPSLGKPVLVMREVTERVEGIEAGTAKLVGTSMEKIHSEAVVLLNEEAEYSRMARSVNPYGDGHASEKIAAVILETR